MRRIDKNELKNPGFDFDRVGVLLFLVFFVPPNARAGPNAG
jgi:hypothetical protein